MCQNAGHSCLCVAKLKRWRIDWTKLQMMYNASHNMNGLPVAIGVNRFNTSATKTAMCECFHIVFTS